VLLRLAYLGVTNVFASLRLLPASDRDKDVEILVLHHQITVLERQLGTNRPRFSPADRAFLAALLHRLPRDVLGRFRLLIRPDTVLRWHRNLLARRHAARSRPRRPGRPGTVRSIRLLVLRLARENPCWGYRRIHGELLVPGIKTAASTVWEILHDAGIDPAPGRASTTWADFLRSQADAVLACDFSETVTVTGVHLFVLAVIEHARRRIRVLGATAHPTASWVAQAVRNLVMDLEDAGSQARFLIRDRDGKFPDLFDTVLKDAGTEVVLSGDQMPRMNAIMERRVQTCRRELPDRTPIWNQAHLLHALRESGQSYNSHRPHQGIANARPLRALPSPIPGLDATTRLHVHRHDHLGGILHEYRHAALPARMRFSASTGLPAPPGGLSRTGVRLPQGASATPRYAPGPRRRESRSRSAAMSRLTSSPSTGRPRAAKTPARPDSGPPGSADLAGLSVWPESVCRCEGAPHLEVPGGLRLLKERQPAGRWLSLARRLPGPWRPAHSRPV
jgi:putative transposase